MNQQEYFEELYEQTSHIVFCYLMSLCHDPALAEDIMQETFVKAMTKIHTFRNDAQISSWLCSIARNELNSWRRRHPAWQEMPSPDPPAKSTPLLDDGLIFEAIHRLPEPSREIVYLRMYGELSFERIGAMFLKSENWARVTYYRAKEKLRKEIIHEDTTAS